MAELSMAFRLPPPAASRAVFVSDYGLRGGALFIDGQVILEAASREALAEGVSGALPCSDSRVELRVADPDALDVRLWLDGVEVPREDGLRVPASRSAWIHAFLALSGSALGFIASWLYVRRANASGDPWAMKMAFHMAAWHLLLTLTLFPASVWGQRIGIRAVQLASLVFFCIHVGIAASNTDPDVRLAEGPWIALLNALSGIAFLVTVIYGQRAHADMSPNQPVCSSRPPRRAV
jgi:hypothetical protein